MADMTSHGAEATTKDRHRTRRVWLVGVLVAAVVVSVAVARQRRRRLATTSTPSPSWAERRPSDIGVTLVELLAYAGDRLSYEQDAVANEAYLDTARQRTSMRRHARLVDRAYRTATDDSGRTTVAFGDEAKGARLPSGTGNVKAVYRTGGGPTGNVDDRAVDRVRGSWRQRASLKGYRVWEANRKVFLWPENWSAPERRTDCHPITARTSSATRR
jgi:hypothetical protein